MIDGVNYSLPNETSSDAPYEYLVRICIWNFISCFGLLDLLYEYVVRATAPYEYLAGLWTTARLSCWVCRARGLLL